MDENETPSTETETSTPADPVEAFASAVEEVSGKTDDTPEVSDDHGTTDAEAAATEPVVEAAAPEAPKEKTEIDKEIEEANKMLAQLGRKPLSDKTAERMRQLWGEKQAAERKAAELEPQVAELRTQADRMRQVDELFTAAQAQPEQLQNALGVIQAINIGTPQQKIQAAHALFATAKGIFEQHGMEIPGGGADPLAAHPDLKDAVDNGVTTRQIALEVARGRATQQRTTEYNTAQSNQQEFQNAVTTAKNELNKLGDTLRANDPHFEAKYAQLKPMLSLIRDNVHPSLWTQKFKDAYLQLPAPAPAPVPPPTPKPRVAAVPVRPTGSNSVQPAKTKDPYEAFARAVGQG